MRGAHRRRCTDEKKPVEVIGGFVLSIMVRHYLGNGVGGVCTSPLMDRHKVGSTWHQLQA